MDRASRAAQWPRCDTAPYMRFWDPDEWTCWHLVVAFYRRELDIILPDYETGSTAERFAAAAASGDWQAVEIPRHGDLAVFGLSREYHGHAGVVVEPLRMLHVVKDQATRLERFDGPGWAPTLRGFFRWREE